MVAKIITGKSLRGALQYNENKVLEAKAELILASGFAGDIQRMNFHQKLYRFENLLMLRPKVKTNTLHISLNFDSAEKLTDETLQRIALSYMDKIGFGDQPFIAYRHNDAGHDHIHLVSTNIRADGERIDLHNIGTNQSEKARKEIEEEFKLVKAQSKKYNPEPGIKAIDPPKVTYGRLPTKRAISNTVNAVIGSYKFTSLAELNAVLKQFNVTADRGAQDTRMFQKKGLIFSLLDQKGNKIGVPIKSSSLYSRPTLPWLEARFAKHEKNKIRYKPELKRTLDTVLSSRIKDQGAFTKAMKEKGIAVVFRPGVNGQTYGVTFVDHNSKTVFNGSDLGKAYSAKAILTSFTQQIGPKGHSSQQPTKPKEVPISRNENDQTSTQPTISTKLLDDLMKDEHNPSAQIPKKKKRKKLKL